MNDDLKSHWLIRETCESYQHCLVDAVDISPDSFLDQALPDLDESERTRYLAALVRCEMEFNRKRGKQIDVKHYARRFPQMGIDDIAELASLPEAPPPISTATGPALPARYRVMEQIGSGGIGVIWRVHDNQMNRSLAIKTLQPRFELDWMANQRLHREAILTGSIQHPGVPPVFESGVLQSGGRYFAMKLVEGQSLDRILETRSDDQPFLISVFEQVAQTLAFAHSNGVIHRDVKPQNIMVGEFGEVQLMDWGMAKRMSEPAAPSPAPPGSGQPELSTESSGDTVTASMDSSLNRSLGLSTKMGDVFGTPAYMSPEQAQGLADSIDERSDVFSLGLLLFEILVGRRRYDESDTDDVIKRAADAEFESVDKSLASIQIDTELADICAACLQPTPADRPKNASFVANAIAEYQSNVQSRLQRAEVERSSALVQTAEQRKRARVIGWMSVLVALVSIAGAAGFIWQSLKTTAAAKRATFEAETQSEIADFLMLDILSQSNPFAQPDRNLKVRTVLDRAAESVGERFQSRPKVESEIRFVLGNCYYGLGEYFSAQEHFRVARDLRVQSYGANSLEVLETDHKLAEIEYKLGNDRQALQMFEQLELKYSQSLGPHSEEAVRALSGRSSVLTSLGKFEQARKLAESVVDLIVNHDILKDELNNSRNKIAVNFSEMGKYDEAEKLFQIVIAETEKFIVKTDDGHLRSNGELNEVIDYINAKVGLGQVLEFRGDNVASEQYNRELLAACEDLVGPRHSMTIEVINNLTISLLHQRKLEEAKPLLEKYVPIAAEMLGSQNGLTFRLKNSLASCLVFLGEIDKATALFLELESDLKIIHGEELHHDVITNHQNLGALYYRTREYELSEERLQAALEQSLQLLGEDNPRTLITMGDLARTRGKLKKLELSEAGFRRSLELGLNVFQSDDHPEMLFTRTELGKMLLETEQFEKAITENEILLAIQDRTLDASNPKIAQTRARLGQALYELKKTDQAEPHLLAAFEFLKSRFGLDHENTADQFAKLIKNLGRGKKYAVAREQIEKYLEELGPDSDSWARWRVQSRLGYILYKLEMFDEARALLEESYDKQSAFEDIPASKRKTALLATANRLVNLFKTTGESEPLKQWRATYESLKK